MKTFEQDILDEIFGIPSKKDINKDAPKQEDSMEDSQDAAYAEVVSESADQSFDDKISSLKKKVPSSPLAEEVEFVDVKQTESSTPKQPTKVEAEPNNEVRNVKSAKEFEQVIKTQILNKTIEGAKEAITATEPISNSVSSSVEKEPTKPDEVLDTSPSHNLPFPSKHTVTDDDLRNSGWIVDPPSVMFDIFYGEKRSVLRKIVSHGEIPINAWFNEIIKAKVNISTVTIDDRALIAEKMKEIQKWKDRLMEIKSRVNRSCSFAKRFLELLRGSLMKVQYDKPIQRQNGTNYEHLKDLEEYVSDLESLNDTVAGISLNLHTTFETLSRIMTLATANRTSFEAYESQSSIKPANHLEIYQKAAEKPKIKNEELEDFDALENDAVNDSSLSEKKTKSREVEWI